MNLITYDKNGKKTIRSITEDELETMIDERFDPGMIPFLDDEFNQEMEEYLDDCFND